jgi:hypothetical protein
MTLFFENSLTVGTLSVNSIHHSKLTVLQRGGLGTFLPSQWPTLSSLSLPMISKLALHSLRSDLAFFLPRCLPKRTPSRHLKHLRYSRCGEYRHQRYNLLHFSFLSLPKSGHATDRLLSHSRSTLFGAIRRFLRTCLEYFRFHTNLFRVRHSVMPSGGWVVARRRDDKLRLDYD